MDNLVKIENNSFLVDEEYVKKYKEFRKLKEYMDLADKTIKQSAKDFMEATGKTNITVGDLCFEYRKATKRTFIDSTKLKKELPDIYEEYSKTSDVSSSVVVKVLEC